MYFPLIRAGQGKKKKKILLVLHLKKWEPISERSSFFPIFSTVFSQKAGVGAESKVWLRLMPQKQRIGPNHLHDPDK